MSAYNSKRLFLLELKIRLQGSPTPDVTCPAVETSAKRVGKADRDRNTFDSKILEHLLKTSIAFKQNTLLPNTNML